MIFLHKEKQVCRCILKSIKGTNKKKKSKISNFTHNRQIHNVESLQNLQYGLQIQIKKLHRWFLHCVG